MTHTLINFLYFSFCKIIVIDSKVNTVNYFTLQVIRQLRYTLLSETLHKIWAIFNWDLDWHILDDKERSAFKAKGNRRHFPEIWTHDVLFWFIWCYSHCCSSGRQHWVGSAVFSWWLCWLDYPTSSRTLHLIHLCHMPSIKGCTDPSGLWLWPGSYSPVRRVMEVNQDLESFQKQWLY